MSNAEKHWSFSAEKGAFQWDRPAYMNGIYFLLCNEQGMMSSITPILHGDIKTGQHNFLTLPLSVEDLHNTKSARNFWLYIDGYGAWSATGNSARQNAARFDAGCKAERSIEAGMLWHKLSYTEPALGLKSEILNFVPLDANIELMQVTVTNQADKKISFTPTSAVPLFGRSAENIRDHRHVTSLVHRPVLNKYGFGFKPLIFFDESGHKRNTYFYYALGADDKAAGPVGLFPIVDNYIGEGGSFEWPEAIVKNMKPADPADLELDGKEHVAALRFADVELGAGQSVTYILALGISDGKDDSVTVFERYNTPDKVASALGAVKEFWQKRATAIDFSSGLNGFSNWMRWVNLQPLFRKIFGNSFLPYHDYGKGGRGWRDLWQDLLSLLLQNPAEVRDTLVDNFGGIRVDGTNATIIGSKPGEFIADRNNISRVWMDHGSWPYLTMQLYIDQTGDYAILAEKQPYFRDAQLKRAELKDETWTPADGTLLRGKNGEPYNGSLLEHMLVQHLVSFFNVGEHNIIRLEDADWNDALDMAPNRGESVPFTALYASNLANLADLLEKYGRECNKDVVPLFKELAIMLDSSEKGDYSNIKYKRSVYDAYMNAVVGEISGEVVELPIEKVAADLRAKAESIYTLLRSQEWVNVKDGVGFFNSYYNDDGEAIDGVGADGSVAMNLIGQVFTVMYGLADDKQVAASYEACRNYLKDPKHGGYRLNTPLDENLMNLGRVVAFAYGEKENGATFSHMVVMYMNALYKRGFVREGYEVFKSMYQLSMDTERARIYPGIPEYFTPSGKGLYPYLTGSASWLLLTVVQEMFGVRGEAGDLVLEPRLTAEQFSADGKAAVSTAFRECDLEIVYNNPKGAEYGDYSITGIIIDGKEFSQFVGEGRVVVPAAEYDKLAKNKSLTICVELG